MKLLAISVMMALFAALPVMAEENDEEPRIVERVIKIEGTIEKPRVIFIVPKARLWRDDELEKSFREDFLRAEYPSGEVFKKNDK